MKVNPGFVVKANNGLLGIKLDDWSTIVSLHNVRLISVSTFTEHDDSEGITETKYGICIEYKDDETIVNIRPPIERFSVYHVGALEIINGLLSLIYNEILGVDSGRTPQDCRTSVLDNARMHA